MKGTGCSHWVTPYEAQVMHGALTDPIPCSSIVNVPGESTLRRDFLRLQQENKERSEALRRQQLLQEQQLREQEEYKRQLLAERQKRIEQQKEKFCGFFPSSLLMFTSDTLLAC